MHYTELGPVMACRLSGGVRSISGIIEDLLEAPGLRSAVSGISPEVLEILGLALNEVLFTVHEFSGEQADADASSVELFADSTLLVVCVKFRGQPLPGWLLSNWDRGQEPAKLAPPTEVGWGWLLVREALDSVAHTWCDSQQILFLERRL